MLSDDAAKIVLASAGPPALGELPGKIAQLEQQLDGCEGAYVELGDKKAQLEADRDGYRAEMFKAQSEMVDFEERARQLEHQGERLEAVANEAERIATEAHLAADHYAYDLMRTVLRPLVGNMEASVAQALAQRVKRIRRWHSDVESEDGQASNGV